MSEEGNRNTLQRYVQALARQDLDAIEDHLHDDYVEEYPQSSERIRGKHNWRSILQNYPGRPNIIDYGFKLGGELGVAELIALSTTASGCMPARQWSWRMARSRGYGHISANHSKHRSGERNGLKGCK